MLDSMKRGNHASMGPPILLGGNPPSPHPLTPSPSCFNGATDFTRWKFFSYGLIEFPKSRLQWGHRFYSVEMERPNPERLGLLRGFNGATDFTRWKLISQSTFRFCCTLLQWGHRFYSVEIEDLPLWFSTNLDASMGPPILLGGNCRIQMDGDGIKHSFNGATDFTRWKSRCHLDYNHPQMPASMGPPILLGGNIPVVVVYDSTGNASMGPPILLGGNSFNECLEHVVPIGFNGATDFTRWKCIHSR